MAMTLLTICQEAVEGIGGLDVPTTIIGNTDEYAVVLKSAAKQVGRELARDYSWQALLTAGTITTVNGTASYALPSAFQRFANHTFWNVSESQELLGPYSPKDWAELVNGSGGGTCNYSIRVAGNYMVLDPTPSSAQTIGYEYYSKQYSTTSGGTAQDNWAADSDLPRLPDDLFILGIRYRFKKSKELPFAQDQADYINAIAQACFDDQPRAISNLSGIEEIRSNIPQGNWG